MIEIKNLTFGYTHQPPILSNIDVTITGGEFVALLGPSGAGKSTLMHIMGLLTQLQQGDYWLDGIDTKTLTKKQQAQYRNQMIGFIFQQYHLLPNMSIKDNICLPWLYGQSQDQSHLDDLIESLGIDHLIEKKANQLSGGEQQRVAIARALINAPKLLLADEPTGALDEDNGERVMTLLRKHRKNRTIVLVTHNPLIAAQCDRIIALKDGQLT
jgi:putative ABC transport system ATP-binding protein